MIEVESLTKRYGEKTVVHDVSFAVKPGLITGFVGPNGAGKSTTMRMMLGLDRPSSGRVRIDGKRYRDLREPLRYIGAMIDARAVHPGRTAYNNLKVLALSNRIPVARVGEVLEQVGLSKVAHRRPKGFSLGMSQRLGIAAALLGDPEIVILDEPVNGLDPQGIHWVRDLMKDLARHGRTVFVSSHLMSEMALTADHIVVIGQGKLLADRPMAEFIDENSHARVRIRSPEPEAMAAALKTAGIEAERPDANSFEIVDGDVARLGDLAFEHRVPLHTLYEQHASLEDAYMELTGAVAEYRTAEPADQTPAEQTPTGQKGEERA